MSDDTTGLEAVEKELIWQFFGRRRGGFFIEVTVFKELEDLPRPVRATQGAAIFRADNNVERQFTVIDPTIFEANWIPRGRDVEVEQVLLRKLKCGF